MKILRQAWLLIFLFAALILLVLPASAAVYGGDCGVEGDHVQWSLDTQTGALEIFGEGAVTDHFPKPWYEYRTAVKSILIEDGVTNICLGAFEGCSKATSVSIPASVTSIGSYAFEGCTSLTSIVIPHSVTSVGIRNCYYNGKWCDYDEGVWVNGAMCGYDSVRELELEDRKSVV